MALTLLAGGATAGPAGRVLSLDQCADQYVMKLAPRETIVGLSPRADDPDSFLRAEAAGLPRRRPTLESALAARPTHVVRYWGGSPALVRSLERRGVKVHTIADVQDLAGVRAEAFRVAAFLGGETARLRAADAAASMDRDRAAAAGAWGGRAALYLTPGGYTSGPGTLVDAIFRAAGLRNATKANAFAPVPLERLVLTPPALLVFGFFDTAAQVGRWSPGRRYARFSFARTSRAATLPGATLGCPAWFATDAVRWLAEAAPR